jgi:hypothetical protein
MTMAINVTVKKNKNENNLSVIKLFTRRVQESGVLSKKRSLRYLDKDPSQALRKSKKLRSIKKRENIEELVKLGKMSQTKTRGKRR